MMRLSPPISGARGRCKRRRAETAHNRPDPLGRGWVAKTARSERARTVGASGWVSFAGRHKGRWLLSSLAAVLASAALAMRSTGRLREAETKRRLGPESVQS